jgi:hypothetical protein
MNEEVIEKKTKYGSIEWTCRMNVELWIDEGK